jgi:hypothetical protein
MLRSPRIGVNLLLEVPPMTNFRDVQDTEKRSPTHDEIELLAYELYLKRGEDGHALEDWLLAEKELRQKFAGRGPIPVKSSSIAAGQRSSLAAGERAPVAAGQRSSVAAGQQRSKTS